MRSRGRERLARDDDLIAAHAGLEREFGRLQRREHHTLVDDLFRRASQLAVRVFLHLRDDELLIERAAINADPDRLVAVPRDAADRRELLVPPLACPHVPRIDPVLVQGGRAPGVARQKEVTVVMEIAYKGSGNARVQHPLLDFGNGRGGFRQIDGHADHLRARFGQLDALLRRRRRISRIRHRHRLHDHGRAAADLHVADSDTDSFVEPQRGHRSWGQGRGAESGGGEPSPMT